MIVFGLVDLVVLCRSRRPTKHDRIWFGLFCDARLIEKAGRLFSKLAFALFGIRYILIWFASS